MMAMTKILAGGAVAAAVISAAPAAAQYYPGNPGYQNPGYGYQNPGYGYQTPGYGYQNPGYGSGGTSQVAVNQCVAAVQQRLSGGYGNYPGSGSYGGYSYYPQANSYPGGRVLGISRIEPRSGGGLTVRGVASSGRYGAYGQSPADLTFRCRSDYRGFITSVDVDRAQSAHGGYDNSPYTPYSNDYSQYGYRRY